MGISPGSPRFPLATLKVQPRSQPSQLFGVAMNRCKANSFSFENITSSKPSSLISTKRRPLSRPRSSTIDTPRGNAKGSFFHDFSASDHAKTPLCFSLETINSQWPSWSTSRKRTPRSRLPAMGSAVAVRIGSPSISNPLSTELSSIHWTPSKVHALATVSFRISALTRPSAWMIPNFTPDSC